VEDHGAGNQHVRLRIAPRYSHAAVTLALVLLALAVAAAISGAWIAAVLIGATSGVLLGRSVFECAVASAAALSGLAAIEKPEEAPTEIFFGQLEVDRAEPPLHASRA
jgi:hypothetical protein